MPDAEIVTLSDGFVTADKVAVVYKNGGNCHSISVICPRCGKAGTLYSYNRARFGGIHLRVCHGKNRSNGCCYFSPSSEGYSFLRKVYEKVRVERRLR